MSQNQSSLRFSLEESIWFKRGQEVEELLSISLDPEISILEQEEYILIQGSLRLAGEFKSESSYTEDYPDFQGTYVDEIRYHEEEESFEFYHLFPVDVTIPKERIEQLEAVDVHIDSFDYVFPEKGCLKLNADITIYGLVNDHTEEEAYYHQEHPKLEYGHEETYDAEEYEYEPLNRDISLEAEPIEELDEYEEVELIPLVNQNEPSELRFTDKDSEDKNEDEDLYQPFTAEAKRKLEFEADAPDSLHDHEENEVSITFSNEQENGHLHNEYDLSTIYRDEKQSHYDHQDYYQEESSSSQKNQYEDSLSKKEESGEEKQEKEKKPKKKDKYESISLTDFFARKEEEAPAKLKVCIVQHGETLDYLAEKYDINVQQILRMNHLDLTQDVHEGQVLYIPSYAVVRK
ncbi:stage VI sporulation protein D [Heyndrickxia acidicola]|uniref:Stage VI sporulation protein D n=1 Tax=Heyndrickxia acidicola TaxID=209389 RepID=A0ABU6MJG5_9BACI|nr:stage VI sporulation protein D [Heyndrickxia acidicola]MED1204818.1 stage VI sporulation protein D [Heyndrickxia acidicola]